MIGGLVRDAVPEGLEARLKASRLDLLALFRAIDQLHMDARELPQPILHELFDLDGDYALALTALDEARLTIDVRAMLRDTRRSLGRLAETRSRFLGSLPMGRRTMLEDQTRRVRPTLRPEDAYHSMPGKDPHAGEPWTATWDEHG